MSSVTKSWAYLAPYGNEWLTAEAIARERVLKYGGEPTGEIYYSAHKPGKRKRMKHVMKKTRNTPPYFSYIDPDGGGGDGGESLTHRLFKQAIANIASTELHLGVNGDHKVRINRASVEKRYPTESEYYADVFVNFESETALGMKWSGELYIEIHHTNAVHSTKRNDLRAARVPVIEVGVPELFEYPYNDAQTTDAREAQHLEKIKRILGKGFLMGKVISNPSSVEYLEMQLGSAMRDLSTANNNLQLATDRELEVRKQVRELEDKLAQQGQENAQLTDELGSANEKLRSATQRELNLSNQMRDLERAIARETDANIQLGLQLTSAKSESERINGLNKSLRKQLDVATTKLELRTNWLAGAGSVLFCTLALLVMHFYFK